VICARLKRRGLDVPPQLVSVARSGLGRRWRGWPKTARALLGDKTANVLDQAAEEPQPKANARFRDRMAETKGAAAETGVRRFIESTREIREAADCCARIANVLAF